MTYYKVIDGKTVYSDCKALEINGRWVSNPTEEMIAQDGWLPYVPPTPPPFEPTYEERVVALIRERYDTNDEYEILRESIAYPHNEEVMARFNEYNSYVEECKQKAKQ